MTPALAPGRAGCGSVVVVNGASSAGTSTLVASAQPLVPRPFVAHGLDLRFPASHGNPPLSPGSIPG